MIRIGMFLIALLLTSPVQAVEKCDRGKHFGGWVDLDGNGLNSREELIEQYVFDDHFFDNYDGKLKHVSVAEGEHIVSVCEAWYHYGADKWTQEKRVQFANDPLNLILVGKGPNASKGRRTPLEWMVRDIDYIPQHIARIRAVWDKYGITPPWSIRRATGCWLRFHGDTQKGLLRSAVMRLSRCF